MNDENKTERLQIPVSPKDRRLIERLAASADLPTATWLRRLIRKEIYSGIKVS